jgi:molecular chaperone GrpE
MEPEKQEQEELNKCKSEREEYLNGWKRAKAELINYQKDDAKRFEEVIRFGYKSIIKDLLALMDSLELAGATPNPDKGLVAIRGQLWELLKKYGVEKIVVKEGDEFNPEKHEAMAEITSDKPEGSIVQELSSGYMLHGQVIRAAKVDVAKK